MGIIHVVLAGFGPEIQPTAVQDVCTRVLGLKEKCIHPTTNKPYIKSSMGGRDNSPENLQHGASHAFIMEFETEEDRNYYVEKDPAHHDLLQSIQGVVKYIQVVDFAPGVF